jgi:hypothetical protein
MRTVMAMASAAFLMGALDVGVAWAEPAPLPEAPPGGRMVFIDNPALVDPHPVAIESWSRAAAEDAVAVNFASGTPACAAVHATAHETADTVTVDLRGGTLPEAVGRMCIMLAVFGTVEVPLQAPLGDRRVLTAT